MLAPFRARLFHHWKFLRPALADTRLHSTGTIGVQFQWDQFVLDGLASANEQVTQTIDATGNVLSTTDRKKTKHVFEYDVLGRMISDTVAESGFGVDTSIRRMGITYDSQGNAATLTSYSDPKGKQIANQVVRTFNNLGELTNEYQSHSGQVNLGSTLKVGYTYADPGTGNNGARQTGMVYPNGRTLTFNYASGTDNNISRLTSISEGLNTLESYQYLGLSTVVVRAHPMSGVDLTYVKPSGDTSTTEKYTGLDRFNRVVDQRWAKNASTTLQDVERYKYTYDPNGNVLSKINTIDSAKTETYSYDNLNQLTGFARGGGAPTPTYTLDGMGNFQAVGTGSTATSQTRTTNSQNEIGSIMSRAKLLSHL